MDRIKYIRISELSAVSGIPAHTIHFYGKEGLLPEPVKTGKTMAYYTEEHLERLQAIKKLREEKHSIGMIKQILDQKRTGDDTSGISEKTRSNRREDIIRSAIHVFREKGFAETSITDIIHHAGAGRGTFYAYFNSKEELFFECADRVFLEIDRDLQEIQDEPDILHKLQLRALHFNSIYPKAMNMINLIRGASVSDRDTFREKLGQIMENLIQPISKDVERGIADGLLRSADPTLVGWMLMGASEYGAYLFHEGYGGSTEAFLQKAWDIIYNGCVVEAVSGKK